jgi:polar amino acid transport system substrate-binding protein
MIVNRTEPFLGVVLTYDCEKPIVRRGIRLGTQHTSRQVVIGFIGAGSYAQQNLLPNIPRDGSIGRAAIVTRSSTTSKRVAERFGFGFCTSDPDEVFDDGAINTIFVATRHDSHADYVKSALGAGKHVFVEKPLCVTLGALNEIEALYYGVEPSVHLMVGFNRRYAPSVLQAKTHFGQMPVSMLYRVNAGSIPENSWVQDRTIGGGRIVGEVCHFLDLLTFFADALPTRVHATALPDPKGLDDTVSINVTFADGSIGTICYFANGSKAVPKEYIEIYGAGMTAVIKDFRGCEIYGEGSPRRRRSRGQDKGQAHMVRAFLDRIRTGGPPLIPPEQIFAVTRATFAVCESLRSSQAVVL